MNRGIIRLAMRSSPTQRIAKNAIMLALLCIVGMFSIPLMENIKVSLQLLAVLIICFLAEGFADALIVISSYVLIGLFLPVYAGFSCGISPTFGFVLGFVLASPAFYFLARLPKIPSVLAMGIAGVVGTLIVYASGTVFMMLYLNWSLSKTLLAGVIPYIPFDIGKIALASALQYALPKQIACRGARKQ